MNGVSVLLHGGSVLQRNTRLTKREVVDYLAKIPEQQREAAFRQAIGIWVFCLEQSSTGRSVEFVRHEVERLLTGVTAELSGLPAKVQEELLKKLGTDDGQALAPVKSLVRTVEAVVDTKVKDVKDLLNQEIDPRNENSTLGRALGSLRILLDPHYDSSIQKKIEEAVNSVSSPEGTLAKTVREVVELSTTPLRTSVEGLTKEIHGEEMVAEALAQTTEKGSAFEDEVHLVLRDWAGVAGADVNYVGPDNQPGDFVIELSDISLAATKLRVVVEAKDRQDTWGKARIADEMAAALRNRGGNYGVFVSRTQKGLAREVGEWVEGQCDQGLYVACLFEHLRTALRFIIVQDRLQQLRKVREGVDHESISAKVEAIRTSLSRLRAINTEVGQIKRSADTIEEEAGSLRREVKESLDEIESLLREKPEAAQIPQKCVNTTLIDPELVGAVG